MTKWIKALFSAAGAASLAACAGVGPFIGMGSEPRMSSTSVTAAAQTDDVISGDDAADDAAIWVHPTQREMSLVLGTDKKAGLDVYDLSGARLEHLPVGRLNNVDLRQGAPWGARRVDLAAATHREDHAVYLFAVSQRGAEQLGAFPTGVEDPYGICMAVKFEDIYVMVTYKSGLAQVFGVAVDPETGDFFAEPAIEYQFESQLEGCVFDEDQDAVYIGEENKGVWRIDLNAMEPEPQLVDAVGGETGLTADVEGLAIYALGDGAGYLLASSQGSNEFFVYDRQTPNAFITKFNIAAAAGGLDAVQETDGIAVSSAALGGDFPEGLFVAQDGERPGEAFQNFKYVDWRSIQSAIDAAQAAQETPGS